MWLPSYGEQKKNKNAGSEYLIQVDKYNCTTDFCKLHTIEKIVGVMNKLSFCNNIKKKSINGSYVIKAT